jgi:molybdenum cofactor sulfurtransferase
VQTYGDKVNSWFSDAIGRPCTFMRCTSSKHRSCTINGRRDRLCRDTRSKLSFVNEGQLLLVSEESISDLNSRLSSGMQFSFPLIIKKEKKVPLFCALFYCERTKMHATTQ